MRNLGTLSKLVLLPDSTKYLNLRTPMEMK